MMDEGLSLCDTGCQSDMSTPCSPPMCLGRRKQASEEEEEEEEEEMEEGRECLLFVLCFVTLCFGDMNVRFLYSPVNCIVGARERD